MCNSEYEMDPSHLQKKNKYIKKKRKEKKQRVSLAPNTGDSFSYVVERRKKKKCQVNLFVKIWSSIINHSVFFFYKCDLKD